MQSDKADIGLYQRGGTIIVARENVKLTAAANKEDPVVLYIASNRAGLSFSYLRSSSNWAGLQNYEKISQVENIHLTLAKRCKPLVVFRGVNIS